MKLTGGVVYEAANMFDGAKGEGGVSVRELKELRPRLAAAKRAVLEYAERGEQGWLDLPEDAVMVRRITALVKAKRRFRTCLVLGIGGSDLGARALSKALFNGRVGSQGQLVFAGANTDPDELHDVLAELDLKDALVNVISKSGETIETLSTFLIVRDLLRKRLGKNFGEQIVATTSEDGGALRELSEREGYSSLPVPKNVGGRFSALSEVALFPLAFIGAPITKILRGAAEECERFSRQSPEDNAAMTFAGGGYLAAKRGLGIHVLMPYAEKLREFCLWYRQLWAESLGKLGLGVTPVAALGATDQHSQLQLYMDGPRDKIVTFIQVERFAHDVRVPASARDIKKLAYLSGIKLSRVLHAEREATAWALCEAGRPNGTIKVAEIGPQSLGSLVMFFEIAVALFGELLEVNAYDQPAVELGKRAMYNLLKTK